jgi:hypothetical protein
LIALMTTTDAVKLSAARALLTGDGVESAVFDSAAGNLWRAIIPQRLMIAEADLAQARMVLHAAGFREAADGDWDLAGERAAGG